MTEVKQETKKKEVKPSIAKEEKVSLKKEVKTPVEEKGAHFANAKSLNLPISTKQSYEIANFLRYKNLQKAKKNIENNNVVGN